MIQQERIKRLNDKPPRKGRYVLYWMQAAQRTEYNHALEYAVEQANASNHPIVTIFGLTARYPEANARHYAFMLEGLSEVEAALRKRGIQLVILKKSPEKAALHMAREASLLVTDAGYLGFQRAWRNHVAERAPCRMVQVETDVIVPLETASPKEEYAAATLRPKLHRLLPDFLVPLRSRRVKRSSLHIAFDGLDLDDLEALLKSLRVDRSVAPVPFFRGGTSKAKRRLFAFIKEKLGRYDDLRNHPSLDHVSNMSPYLHYGQISPLHIALKAKDARVRNVQGKASFLEELIVRRELSMNFVYYNDHYDSLEGLPDWAQNTLWIHESDRREFTYSLEEWEAALTHDPYWNAAQEEMVYTGKMHNYMRMYWGKKILEWSASPEEAYRTALYLNNRYELDGRDPNSFTGVAWCFGKHDRPWAERPVFGKVRYMNAKGLERKFDMAAYLDKVRRFKEKASRGGVSP